MKARPAAQRLLLVGGGHAMLPLLTSAAALVARGVEVTLLTDHPQLYYSGMVPEYLGGVYAREQVTIDLRAWCARAGVVFAEGTAVALDAGARTVTTACGTPHGFDVAAFDIGAANPQRASAPDAIPTKPLHGIERLEAQLRAALEPLRQTPHEVPHDAFSLAIAGGGAAGVEVALNVSARAHAGSVRLTVLEPSGALLPGFPAGMQRHVRRLLEQRGATVRAHARVARADAAGVVLASGEALPADAVLWATGSTGQPLFREAGLPVDARGFVRVDAHLRVEGHPHLFAAGDCAVVRGYERLARVGVHAVKQGPVLRANVHAALGPAEGGPLRAFRPYPLAPLILSTGTDEALWTAGPLWLRGRPLLRLKHAVDRRWMRRYLLGGTFDGLLDARAALPG